MAYSDAIRTANATMEGVATLIDGVHTLTQNALITYQQATLNTLINITSGAGESDYTSASLTVTLATGDVAEIHGMIMCSAAGTPVQIGMHLRRDTTNLGNRIDVKTHRNDTAGYDHMLVSTYIDAPGAGTYTYKIRWVVGSTTAYSLGGKFTVKVLQNT